MQHLEKVISILSHLLAWLAALCLTAMMLHVCLDVLLKYFFNHPIPGTAEVVANYYMVGAVFLPLALVEMRNGGISVDLFYLMFGRTGRRFLIILAYLGQTTFFSLLAYQSFLDALQSFAKGEYIDGEIVVVVWPASFIIPVGLGVAALVSVLRIIQTLTRSDWEQTVEYQAAEEEDRPIQEVA